MSGLFATGSTTGTATWNSDWVQQNGTFGLSETDSEELQRSASGQLSTGMNNRELYAFRIWEEGNRVRDSFVILQQLGLLQGRT